MLAYMRLRSFLFLFCQIRAVIPSHDAVWLMDASKRSHLQEAPPCNSGTNNHNMNSEKHNSMRKSGKSAIYRAINTTRFPFIAFVYTLGMHRHNERMTRSANVKKRAGPNRHTTWCSRHLKVKSQHHHY